MSGHSKWSSIKHKKGINDAKRANVFTKIARMISVAAREGGGDLSSNFKLKMVVDKARSENMPKDNIERAIKRGTGELKDGNIIEEVIYEAYGPSQEAMLIKVATDNKNRTFGEVRNILAKNGGKIVTAGAISYMFNQVGEIEANTKGLDKDDVEMKIIESGAEDFEIESDTVRVYVKLSDLKIAKENLEKENFQILNAQPTFVATQKKEISEAEREKYENLLEKLDENDDVVEIYDNLK
ncbi:MAG: YebC/PmpR family DNA-binding transcriptional regulator [Candidatus Moraniibacteriota bacterium]